MSSNILIVESKNDKYFLQAVIKYLNFKIEIGTPIIVSEDDYRQMEGLDLKKALKDLKASDIQKKDVEKVGIVIDIDDCLETDRIRFVNDCVQEVFPRAAQLTNIKQFIPLNLDGFNVQLACYFTNVNGQGELETVLKNIKSQDSVYADCLESWKECLQKHEIKISDKDFNKFWVSNYLRFDTCSKDDRKQAGRKCNMESAMSEEKAKVIWDFDHTSLTDLKEFLHLFR